MAVLKQLLTGIILCWTIQTQAQIFKPKNNAETLYEQALQETKLQHYSKAITLSKQALQEQPGFIDQQLLLGRLYLLTRQYDLARKYVKEVLAKNPRYRDAYYYAINIELSTGRYAEAACYTDEALSYYPGSMEFMLKKLGILNLQHKIYQGNELAEQLMSRYPQDTTVRNAYVEHYLESGNYYQQLGNNGMARQSYDRVLLADPQNTDAREANLAVTIKGGSYQSALDQVNEALTIHPGSYELLMRKLGILQDMHAYADALGALQEILRRYPSDGKARTLEISLRIEAAGYYANTDPYTLYEGVLEKDPGNREALDKLIGYSMARGAYREALAWINRGLKSSPNDSRLLALKMDVLEGDRKYGSAAALAEILYQRTPNPDLKDRLVLLEIANGREYLTQQQYDLALAAFESALKVSPSDTTALDLVANTWIAQKDNNAALKVLDQALGYYPGNERFLLKKSAVLADAGRYEEAAAIASQLANRYPANTRYSSNLADLHLTAGRNLMRAEEYDLAKQQFEQVLAIAPSNMDALDYMINLQSATGEADSALYFADKALTYYPDNRDFLLKKASVLQDMHEYTASAAISGALMQKYPYTLKYKNTYTTSLMAAGAEYQRRQQYDSALTQFNQVLALNPKDSLALLYSINILNGQHRYDSALTYAAQGNHYYPDNEAFLIKRAISLENKKDYAAAALAADSVVKLQPSATNTDYRDYLESKTLTNQFALYYLNSTYDYTSNKYNIATVEYRHFLQRGGSYAVQLNYAGRQNGNGLQGLAELYYTHNPKLYSYGLLAYSNKTVFPQIRASYSIFKTFKKDIEVELGARYLNLDSLTSVSGVVSIAKPFDDFWINLRGFVISESPNIYTAFNLTARYYMNRRQDYLQVIGGLGTSPDDRSRLINFPNLSGLLSHDIGVGYQKIIRYRTTLGLFGTWYNQKISDVGYQNQYDIYITVQRKF
ncbi:tetratricopeptide repeat protein [Chitinophaga sp. 30R24]|uniref:tetratricopeptide repeat protein n=1 Tax=Chitinophaga sp. 30R24 TaxID=3248838 RepID=UPI003B8F0458